MKKINDEQALEMYAKGEMSDKEIAKHFGVDRTSVVHMRSRNQMESRKFTGDIGLEIAENKLKSLGFEVFNAKKELNKTYEFDLLVNWIYRVEVMTAKINKDGNFKYALTNSKTKNIIESDIRIRLKNDRIRKLYRKTCDIILAIGIEKKNHFWVIPSENISDTLITLSLSLSDKSKYADYYENWKLFKKPK